LAFLLAPSLAKKTSHSCPNLSCRRCRHSNTLRLPDSQARDNGPFV
jgi:hypothetical protein